MRARRSLISAIGVTGVLVATVMTVAPGSASATVQQVAVGTTVNDVLGGPTYIGKPTTVGLTLTNNSTTKAKLGAFTIVAPLGLGSVAKGSVTPSTWKETSLSCGRTPNCAALILVTPSSPLASALIPVGGTVTARLSFTPPAAGTFAFPILGIGLGSGVYTASGSVTVSAATALKITSIVDTSQSPALSTPLAGQSFAVKFTATDTGGNPVPQPNIPVTLAATNGGGNLTVGPPTTVSTGADGTGTFVATFDTPRLGLNLRVSSPGLSSGDRTTDIASAGVAKTGTPNVPLSLDTTGASADLPNGSVGLVTLTQTQAPCADSSATDCLDVTLDGSFTNGSSELYSFDHPGTVSLVCRAQQPDSGPPVFTCPHADLNGEPSSGENFSYFGSDDADQEQIEDFDIYKVKVALKGTNGQYGNLAVAPACQDLTDTDEETPPTGVIATTEAQAAGFCVDVFAMSRTDKKFSGDLTIPILFVEDPKMRLP